MSTLQGLLGACLRHQIRRLSSSEAGTTVTRPAFYRVKKLQKRFSQNDGVPVHLKAGARDRVLYKATWVLVLVGDLWALKVAIWDMSVHKWLQTF